MAKSRKKSRGPNRGCSSGRGTPLRGYPSRSTAEQSARQIQLDYGRATVAYECQRCWDWHLCPADRHTPSHACKVCPKLSYETEEGAKRRRSILQSERGEALSVYQCPHGDGWHLTSQPQIPGKDWSDTTPQP